MPNEDREDLERLRTQIARIEERARRLQGIVDDLTGRVEAFDPMLDGSSRAGLPLEVFTRLAVMGAGFHVEGSFSFMAPNEDGAKSVDRSVDTHALCRSAHVVPPNDWHPGFTVNETDHLLIECKQRREGVRWIFFELPTGKFWDGEHKPKHLYSKGLEQRPGKSDAKESTAATGLEKGLWQLELAFMPFLRMLEMRAPTRESLAKTRDEIHLILVTNAELFVFEPPATFDALRDAPPGSLFKAVDEVLVGREMREHLRNHQRDERVDVGQLRDRGYMRIGKDKYETVLDAFAERVPWVRVVRFSALPGLLESLKKPGHDQYGRRFSLGPGGMEYDPVILREQVREYMHRPSPGLPKP